MPRQQLADPIRKYFLDNFVNVARRKNLKRFKVTTGEIVRALRLNHRVPAVCSALTTESWLQEQRIRIVKKEGPPSGQGTRLTITYEFADDVGMAGDRYQSLLALAGIGKKVFQELGGGERFIEEERSAWKERP